MIQSPVAVFSSRSVRPNGGDAARPKKPRSGDRGYCPQSRHGSSEQDGTAPCENAGDFMGDGAGAGLAFITAMMAAIHLAMALYCACTASSGSRVLTLVNFVQSGSSGGVDKIAPASRIERS